MAVVVEGLTVNDDGMLCFGNYEVKEKLKVKGKEILGDIYSVKTHNEVTRLEKNGMMLVESVPGAAFFDFKETEGGIAFSVCGKGNTQITLELLADTEYKLAEGNDKARGLKSSMSGKISFSCELNKDKKKIVINKV